jgi:hypothetical protein
MARSDTTIDLTDAEKRDLIAIIQTGKPLPGRDRFMLFEDKREVELVWNGKTRDVCTTVPRRGFVHRDDLRAAHPDAGFAGGGWVDPCASRSPRKRIHARRLQRGLRPSAVRQRGDLAQGVRSQRSNSPRQHRVIDIFGNDTMTMPPWSVD